MATDIPNTIPCKICKEQIQAGAVKCVHCDSFQDWRGSLSFSSTVLGLLVALVSVLAFALPIFKDLFTPKNSRLIIADPKPVPTAIKVIITNTGVRPGIFDSAIAIIHYKDSGEETGVRLWQREGDMSSLILAGTTKELNLGERVLLGTTVKHTVKEPREHDECFLSVVVTNFDGTQVAQRFPLINCDYLAGAIGFGP